MQSAGVLGRRFLPHSPTLISIQTRRQLSSCFVLPDGSIRVDNNDGENGSTPAPPGPGQVTVKLVAAPCTPADLRTLAAAATAATAAADPSSRTETETLASHSISSSSSSSVTSRRPTPSTTQSSPPPPPLGALPFVGGSEGIWEVIATGGGVSGLRPGDLAVPAILPGPGYAPETVSGTGSGKVLAPPEEEMGTWRTTATLAESSLVRAPKESGAGGGGWPELAVAAHCSRSVATAIRILEDFAEKELGAGDRVVFTGASSAVAQILLQLAALRGLESVCLVHNDVEAALALRLGAKKATLLKEQFKAMRMDNAYLVADGEGGVLGFTAARALRFRGCYVSYADVSGGGVSLPVAGQIFSDTKCRGFSLSRWASTRSVAESRELVRRSVEMASAVGLRLEETREFDLNEAVAAIDAARTHGGPVLLRGG